MSTTATSTSPRAIARIRRAIGFPDLWCGMLALALVLAAVVVGFVLNHRPRSRVFADAAPFFGRWLPHIGSGTPFSIMVAVLVVARGTEFFARLAWRRALVSGYLVTVGWTFSLAMIDGWQRGVVSRLDRQDEYLPTVRHITDIPAFVRDFTQHIFGNPQFAIHVAGDPPGGTLIFVWLSRIGLSGAAVAAIVCVLIGGLAPISVAITMRALGSESAARAILPFGVLFPGAVWIGVSADGMFAGICAVGVAIFAVGSVAANRMTAIFWQLLGGVILGFGAMCSYGLILMAPIAVAVTVLTKNWRALLFGVLGASIVFAIFAAAGFWWLDGYFEVRKRYFQGIGTDRSYGYWVWANLACVVASAGPFVAAGLRRAATLGRRVITEPAGLLSLAAAIAIVVADISGLSKAETERIWLPFTVWLIAGAALLPAHSRKWWLAAQAATALVVNHVILTGW